MGGAFSAPVSCARRKSTGAVHVPIHFKPPPPSLCFSFPPLLPFLIFLVKVCACLLPSPLISSLPSPSFLSLFSRCERAATLRLPLTPPLPFNPSPLFYSPPLSPPLPVSPHAFLPVGVRRFCSVAQSRAPPPPLEPLLSPRPPHLHPQPLFLLRLYMSCPQRIDRTRPSFARALRALFYRKEKAPLLRGLGGGDARGGRGWEGREK